MFLKILGIHINSDINSKKGSSGEKHIIFVVKAHKIIRLVAIYYFFLDYPYIQDRLPSALE